MIQCLLMVAPSLFPFPAMAGSVLTHSASDFQAGKVNNTIVETKGIRLNTTNTPSDWTCLGNVFSPPTVLAPAFDYDTTCGTFIMVGRSEFAAEEWTYEPASDVWMTINTSNAMPSDTDYRGAYDGANRKMIFCSADASKTYTYDVLSAKWTNKNPAKSPTAGAGYAMAFDVLRGETVIFGGETGSTGDAQFYNETWSYNSTTNTWTNRTTAQAPPGRANATMAYDSSSKLIVLFGGRAYNQGYLGLCNDTWTYDLGMNAWTNKSPATSPPARELFGMGYHAQMGETMLYGGLLGIRPRYGNDTWTYNLTRNTWTNISTTSSPPPRCFHSLAYDPLNGKMIMAGGLSPSDFNWRADSWSYNQTSNEWEMGTRNAPSWRTGEQLAYDNDTGEVFLFGGYDGARYPGDSDLAKLCCGDTWKYDVGRGNWTLLSPTKACQKIAPQSDERTFSGGTMVYDSRAKEMILFGPFAGSWDFSQNTTYAYNIATNVWTDRKATGAPLAGPGIGGTVVMAYDPGAGETVMYRSGAGPNLYSYNSSNIWTARNPENKTATPFDHASMVYMESTGEILLFGSLAAGPETWSYNFSNDEWIKIPNANNPSPRIQFSMAYDSFRDEVILFGGYDTTLTSVKNDTWCFDVAKQVWTELKTAVKPPAMQYPMSFYHGAKNELLLLGGMGAGKNAFPDLWAFDRMLYCETGNYTSEPIPIGENASFGSIAWDASIPVNTSIRVQLRSGNSTTILNSSAFTGRDGTASTGFSNGDAIPSKHNGNRLIQYRVSMNSSSEWLTPIFRSIRITYNLLHTVNITSPNFGSNWTVTKAINWKVEDPDNDGFKSSIELLDANNRSIKFLALDCSTFQYYWNTNPVPSGEYRIRIVATDNNTAIPLVANATSPVFKIFHPNHAPEVTLLWPDSYDKVNTSDVELEWNGSDEDGDVLNYSVFVGDEEFFEDTLPPIACVTTEESAIISNLTNGTTYYWSVIANDGKENSTLPAASRFTIELPNHQQKNHPPEVTLLAPADGGNATNIWTLLSWSGSDADFDSLSYYVFLAEAAFDLSVLPPNPTWTNETSFNATGLKNGTTYYWAVLANDTKENGTGITVWKFTVHVVIPPDTPKILIYSPTGTKVSLNPSILVGFDREMNATSVFNALSLDPPDEVVGFNPLNNKTAFTFTLDSSLKAETTYTVLVATSVKSSLGKNMFLNFSWNFTTLAAGQIDIDLPSILLTDPSNGTSNVDRWKSIVIVFSEAMDLNATLASCSMVPAENGAWQWMNNKGFAVQFPPTNGFANGTYRVTISSSAKDESGNPLDGNGNGRADGSADSVIFNFTVGTPVVPRPKLLSWSPDGGGIRLRSNITLTFDTRMNLSSVEKAFTTEPKVAGTWAQDPTGKVLTFTPSKPFKSKTPYTISLETGAADIDGNRLEQKVSWSFSTVDVVISASIWANEWLVLALVVIVVAVIAALAFSRARKAAAQAAAGAAAQSAPKGFAMEDIFLMYNDGRLIQHSTRRIKADMDVDLFTSMLNALQGFVKESVGHDTGDELGSMEYGGNKILLEKGKYVVVAVVITGGEPAGFRDEMKAAIKNIESEYGTVLQSWDGGRSRLAGAKKFLAELGGYKVTEEAAAKKSRADVALKSEVEFYQGFVRLKVAVKNNMATMIAKASFKLIYNENMLRLDHIEPVLDCKGDEVMLGIIEPSEKKTVAFYLDPQICTESFLEGVLTFKDALGNLETVKMPRKLTSVVCPILYTDENINTAMLKRMIAEELDKKDSKAFTIPPDLSFQKAFELGKAAVQHHDIRLVRELKQERPLMAEAWYYGKAKGRSERLVVKARIIAELGFLEFFVASDSVLMLTGMLAELKTDLHKELERQKLEGSVEQVTGRDDMDALAALETLLDRAKDDESG